MSDRPSVDVIIPTFGRSSYLREAVASVLTQSYPPHTVIVVDDGSTEDIASVLLGLEGPIRVIRRHVSGGAGAARNAGLAESTSPLIAFLDDDDRWLPDKLEQQVAWFEANSDCCLVHTAARFISGDGETVVLPHREPTSAPLEGQCLARLVGGSTIFMSSVVLLRECLGEDRFDETLRNAEDWDLWLRLAGRGRFGYLQTTLVEYRVHAANKSASGDRMDVAREIILNRVLTRESDPAVQRTARLYRHATLLRRAHLAYTSGRLADARSRYKALVPRLGFAGWVRFSAIYLPEPIRAPLRMLWQGLLAARRSSR